MLYNHYLWRQIAAHLDEKSLFKLLQIAKWFRRLNYDVLVQDLCQRVIDTCYATGQWDPNPFPLAHPRSLEYMHQLACEHFANLPGVVPIIINQYQSAHPLVDALGDQAMYNRLVTWINSIDYSRFSETLSNAPGTGLPGCFTVQNILDDIYMHVSSTEAAMGDKCVLVSPDSGDFLMCAAANGCYYGVVSIHGKTIYLGDMIIDLAGSYQYKTGTLYYLHGSLLSVSGMWNRERTITSITFRNGVVMPIPDGPEYDVEWGGTYRGECVGEVMHGYGVLNVDNVLVIGTFVNGVAHGMVGIIEMDQISDQWNSWYGEMVRGMPVRFPVHESVLQAEQDGDCSDNLGRCLVMYHYRDQYYCSTCWKVAGCPKWTPVFSIGQYQCCQNDEP